MRLYQDADAGDNSDDGAGNERNPPELTPEERMLELATTAGPRRIHERRNGFSLPPNTTLPWLQAGRLNTAAAIGSPMNIGPGMPMAQGQFGQDPAPSAMPPLLAQAQNGTNHNQLGNNGVDPNGNRNEQLQLWDQISATLEEWTEAHHALVQDLVTFLVSMTPNEFNEIVGAVNVQGCSGGQAG